MSQIPLLGVTLVVWNAKPYMKHLMESLKQQDQDFDLYVYDNGSTPEIQFLRAEFARAHIYGDGKNIGFAKAHNLLIQKAQNPYILLLNQDIILDDRCFSELKKCIQEFPDIGSIAPKLYKAEFFEEDVRKTNYFDTTALQGYKNRKFCDRDATISDEGQRNEPEYVFGPSAALAVYNKKAMQHIAYHQAFFDESFISYKEDIDLAWRLQLAGYQSLFLPNAKAWHFRSLQKEKREKTGDITRNRKKRKDVLKRYSYANHLKLLMKNEDDVRALLPILWYECKKMAYLICFEPKTMLGWYDVISQLPDIYRKRKHIHRLKRVTSGEIAKRFFR